MEEEKKEYVTAIITPARETMQEVFGLTDNFFESSDLFIDDENIKNWVAQDIKKFSIELSKFERIKHFKIKRNPFSIEEGEITPTMKPKRKVIENKYKESIDEMYKQEVEVD